MSRVSPLLATNFLLPIRFPKPVNCSGSGQPLTPARGAVISGHVWSLSCSQFWLAIWSDGWRLTSGVESRRALVQASPETTPGLSPCRVLDVACRNKSNSPDVTLAGVPIDSQSVVPVGLRRLHVRAAAAVSNQANQSWI